MQTISGIVTMLLFGSLAMIAMENYKLVSRERAKKTIINGYRFVIALACLGAIFVFGLALI